MTGRENASMFLLLIYVHWSLENMIIWPEQMDGEIPKGFCAKRSHARGTNGVHMLEEELNISVPHLLLLLSNELLLCSALLWRNCKMYNSVGVVQS